MMTKAEEIEQALSAISDQHQVKILYACESGSRAWGFPSATSDYDVRFLFVHPRDHYCSVREPAKQIGSTIGDLDIEGWDLRKALLLLRKMNPSLLEWLHSPFVFHVEGETSLAMNRLVDEHFSPAACYYHYRNLAAGNYAKYLSPLRGAGTDRTEVEVKRYLYVCRALLAARWAVLCRSYVPAPMKTLLCEGVGLLQVASPIADAIRHLVLRREAGDELAVGPRIEILDQWILEELSTFADDLPEIAPIPWKALDQIMLDALQKEPAEEEAWNGHPMARHLLR
jgi:predicted nucleotidyltransferase